MLTILIEDIRSGVTDHQLAEVRVPLYDKQDRYWADSQEICEQLQSSPSRIDGEYHGTDAFTYNSCRNLQGPRGCTHSAENIVNFFCE
jgi:hypothetical protein